MTSSRPAAAHAWPQEIRAAPAHLPQQRDRDAMRAVADGGHAIQPQRARVDARLHA